MSDTTTGRTQPDGPEPDAQATDAGAGSAILPGGGPVHTVTSNKGLRRYGFMFIGLIGSNLALQLALHIPDVAMALQEGTLTQERSTLIAIGLLAAGLVLVVIGALSTMRGFVAHYNDTTLLIRTGAMRRTHIIPIGQVERIDVRDNWGLRFLRARTVRITTTRRGLRKRFGIPDHTLLGVADPSGFRHELIERKRRLLGDAAVDDRAGWTR